MKNLSRRGLLGLAVTASGAPVAMGTAGLLAEVVGSVARRGQGRRALTGVPTGIAGMDVMTGGLQPGHLIIVAAGPGFGKTAWATSATAHAAIRYRIPVLFFSFTGPKEDIMERLLASEARVEATRMRRGAMRPTDWNRLSAAAAQLGPAPIVIDDAPMPVMGDVRRKLRQFRADLPPAGLALAVFDDLRALLGPRQMAGQEPATELLGELKAMARESSIPIALLWPLAW